MRKLLFAAFACLTLVAGAALAAVATLDLPLARPVDARAPPDGSGAWPSQADALHALERHGAILLRASADFSPANGVRSGAGTPADPYLVEDVFATSLTIRDLNVSVELRHDYVSGALTLDWTGPTARLVDSYVGTLVTNTNRPHHAEATWLDVVGSRIGGAVLRHAGGDVVESVIGPDGPSDPGALALNVEGYDGLRLANDTVRGPVELRLHGHHFSGSFADAWMPMDMPGNATDRYDALSVVDDVFVDPTGRGVDVSDRDHAANDRTASSDPDPALNLPHRHFTDVQFDRDTIEGAGLLVEDANASDPHHLPGGSTHVHVGDLAVVDPLNGVAVRIAQNMGADVAIEGGSLRMTGRVAGSVGVLVDGMTRGSVDVRGVTIQGFDVGVQARHVGKNASWSVQDETFLADGRDVDWDSTVRAAPQRSEA
jgi:hypothetical protein